MYPFQKMGRHQRLVLGVRWSRLSSSLRASQAAPHTSWLQAPVANRIYGQVLKTRPVLSFIRLKRNHFWVNRNVLLFTVSDFVFPDLAPRTCLYRQRGGDPAAGCVVPEGPASHPGRAAVAPAAFVKPSLLIRLSSRCCRRTGFEKRRSLFMSSTGQFNVFPLWV